MAVKRIKVKAGEDLSPANIDRVIQMLSEGCTKKAACEALGISYNTKRLTSIIEGHEARMDFEKKQRAKMRGKPVSKEEVTSMIQQYLTTGSMEQVAQGHWRSTAVVKQVLENHGALLKAQKTDYFNPMLLPDECVAESFEKGELVWSARYNCAAEIDKCYGNDTYRIWILGPNCQFAIQPLEELGSLKHLQALGVNIQRIIQE